MEAEQHTSEYPKNHRRNKKRNQNMVRPNGRTIRFENLGSYTIHLSTILCGFTRMHAQSL